MGSRIIMRMGSNLISSVKTALIVKVILELSTRGFGEYVTITYDKVMSELRVRDGEREKYKRNFALALKFLEPCLVDKKGLRMHGRYIFRRSCLWRFIQLGTDFGD